VRESVFVAEVLGLQRQVCVVLEQYLPHVHVCVCENLDRR
jgi:hypothetical protein